MPRINEQALKKELAKRGFESVSISATNKDGKCCGASGFRLAKGIAGQSTSCARLALLAQAGSGEVIVDFLLSPGVSYDVTFSCLRYTREPDGKGLIALQYDERFKLGQVTPTTSRRCASSAIDG